MNYIMKNIHDGNQNGDFILIPFRPIVRKIEILETNIQFMDKRVLPRKTFCKLNPSILPKTKQDLRKTWK